MLSSLLSCHSTGTHRDNEELQSAQQVILRDHPQMARLAKFDFYNSHISTSPSIQVGLPCLDLMMKRQKTRK